MGITTHPVNLYMHASTSRSLRKTIKKRSRGVRLGAVPWSVPRSAGECGGVMVPEGAERVRWCGGAGGGGASAVVWWGR